MLQIFSSYLVDAYVASVLKTVSNLGTIIIRTITVVPTYTYLCVLWFIEFAHFCHVLRWSLLLRRARPDLLRRSVQLQRVGKLWKHFSKEYKLLGVLYLHCVYTHSWNCPSVLPIYRLYSKMTMEVILSTAFGRAVDVQGGNGGKLYEAAIDAFASFVPGQDSQITTTRILQFLICEHTYLCMHVVPHLWQNWYTLHLVACNR